MPDTAALIRQLDAPDAAVRRAALEQLAAQPAPAERQPLHVNMHCHTCYSYNGYGASPSTIAWRARQDGWHAAGICDFDVLDAMPEFLAACDLLGVRGTANLESRVFFREYASHVINSPGEPGVYYFMGAGFVTPPAAGTAAAAQLAAMRQGATARNRDVVARVNAYLAPLTLDYDRDVLPLTPAGNATERHLVSAYFELAQRHFPAEADRLAFWQAKLGTDEAKTRALLAAPMDFNDAARSKLMKAGGPGYVAPTPATFPALDDVIAMILACGAIPMATWLDGTSSGEADIATQLACLRAKGVAALNIIPDRNWNLKKPDERALKIAKLHEVVAVADRLELPVNIGTELNKYGQPWVDDFTAEPMRVVAPSFIRGARIMVAHTWLLRYAQAGYLSAQAAAEWPTLSARNAAFASLGALPPPSAQLRQRLAQQTAAQNFALLATAAKQGRWA